MGDQADRQFLFGSIALYEFVDRAVNDLLAVKGDSQPYKFRV